jgi:hypothetical protein
MNIERSLKLVAGVFVRRLPGSTSYSRYSQSGAR